MINKKISLNICFLEISEEFRRDKTEFELAMVTEPSVFELLRFDYTYISAATDQHVFHIWYRDTWEGSLAFLWTSLPTAQLMHP